MNNNNPTKLKRLYISFVCDIVGMLSFSLPLIGESFDFIWAPLASFIILRMYPGVAGKVGAVTSFIEELTPFLDFIPTFTLTWIYYYYIKKPDNKKIAD